MSGCLRVCDLPRTEEESVNFFQERHLLPKTKVCVNNHEMKLYFGSEYPFWQCNLRSCRKKVGVRVGTWFEHGRLPYTTVVRFIYFWAEEQTSIQWCAKQLKMSHTTVIDWNNYMREVCVFAVENKNSGKIGGEGKIVEIDETLLTKRESNAGRVLPQQWVLGGLCRETGQRFLVTGPTRDAKTLLSEIKTHIEPGTTIICYCWKGYRSEDLEEAGFSHSTVNHRFNFADPDSGASTQQVERMWGSAKWRNKRHRGTARHHLDSYLSEYMWRSGVAASGGDAFNSILADIAAFWEAQKQLAVTSCNLHSNPDLVGLSPDVLNSRKKICEDHFRSQDLLPSGRLLIGAVPIPYAPETETKEPLPLKDVSTGINAENSHLKATRTSSSSVQGKRKRKVKKAEDLPSTSTHTDSDVQHLQEYHDETPIDERQVELPVIKQEELMLEDYEGPMEEPYEQCDPVENSDVPSNVEPIPKVKEEIIATPFETVYFQEGPIKIKQEVVEQDIFDKTEDTNIYDPSTSSQAVDSFVKLDANKEKLPTTEIPSTMGPKSNRKNSKGHKGPIFLGCEHCLNEFFSSEEDFLEHCRTKHKGTSGSRAKRPRVSRSSDPPSKKPSHQHIKDDDPLDGFFVSLKKVQVENRNATRKKVLELVSLISKQKIDPSLVTFSVQSLPSQLV